MNSELTQYLQDSWKAIIDADVDGPNAEPVKIDAGKPLFGQRSLTRRLARTVFFGAAPTIGSAHKGLETQRVFLGTAIPGDVPGNFHSALAALADRATYFYSAGGRYWYDLQANISRRAKDQAERLHAEEVYAEIARRLDGQAETRGDVRRRPRLPRGRGRHPRHRRGAPGHPAPQAHAQARRRRLRRDRVRQERDRASRQRRTGRTATCSCTSPATATASRSSSARCASTSAGRRSSPRRTTSTSPRASATRRPSGGRKASETADARLLGAYQWALVPTGQPIEIQATKVEGQATSLAERVSRRLGNDGALTVQHAAPAIRHQLDTTAAKLWADGHVDRGRALAAVRRVPVHAAAARPRGARRGPHRAAAAVGAGGLRARRRLRRGEREVPRARPADGRRDGCRDRRDADRAARAGEGAARGRAAADEPPAPEPGAGPEPGPGPEPAPAPSRRARRGSSAASACRPTATHRTSRSSPTRSSARSGRRPA